MTESDFATRIECRFGALADSTDRILTLADLSCPSEHFKVVATADKTALQLPALTLDDLTSDVASDASVSSIS